MEVITFDTVKNIWENKLSRNFDAGKESFNLYIDSPFCLGKKCRYCCYEPNILSTLKGIHLKDRYYDTLLIENIREFGEILSLRYPDTVYFGGGSSSLMSERQMENIFLELQACFNFKDSVKEKTFELHPAQVTEEKIELLDKWRFTHVTIGVQSFDRRVLKYNNRVNPSIERLQEIFKLFEERNFQYNMDLMTFIFRKNIVEDLNILEQDLQIAINLLNPCRITIFPNYFQLLDMKDPSNPANPSKSIPVVFEKVRNLRKLLREFENEEYEYIGAETPGVDLSNYRLNYYLVRRGYFDDITYNCSGWSDPSCRGFIKNQNVLALGGYRERKPYSYISDQFCCNSINTGSSRIFEVIYSNIRF